MVKSNLGLFTIILSAELGTIFVYGTIGVSGSESKMGTGWTFGTNSPSVSSDKNYSVYDFFNET